MKLRWWPGSRHGSGTRPTRSADLPVRLVDSKDRNVHLLWPDDLAAGALAGRFKVLCGRMIFAHSMREAGHKLCVLCEHAVGQGPAAGLIPRQRPRHGGHE